MYINQDPSRDTVPLGLNSARASSMSIELLFNLPFPMQTVKRSKIKYCMLNICV